MKIIYKVWFFIFFIVTNVNQISIQIQEKEFVFSKSDFMLLRFFMF